MARRLLILLTTLFAPSLGLAADDALEPYVAYVAQSDATLRSGPGEKYYATEKLTRGASVEIYAHENEFAAIRPPKASFSWTPAIQVRVVSAGVAEVIDEEAVSWIGSSLDQPAEPRWQVKLRRGERLQILGEKRIEEGDSSVWYKIAPPAGEFRWVRLAELTRDPPAQAAAPTPSTGWTVRSSHKQGGAELGVSRPQLTPIRNDGGDSQPGELLPIVSNEPFQLTLSRLELELSLLATRPSGEWALETLRRQAESLTERAENTLERAESRKLIEKIADFDELKKRRESLANWGSERPASATVAESIGEPARLRGVDDAEELPIEKNDSPDSAGPQFDGQGKLLPVVTSNPRTPSFALMDENGKLIQYITPAPGLNMHRYLRKKIGVYGQSKYVPWLKANHLTASRVVVLDR